MMQCRDVRELADSFLSEQLLVETNHEIVRHLESCESCRAELASRRALRTSLRSALERAPELQPRPDFAADVMARLRASQPAVQSRRSFLQTWWGVAAGVAAAAAGGGYLAQQSRTRASLARLARQAAGDHEHCAVSFSLRERPIPIVEAAARYGAPYTQLASFTFPSLSEALQIVDRHSCVYDDRRFAHIVLQHGGVLTSLLITEGPPPSRPTLESAPEGPLVASLPAGPFVGFVVARTDEARLLGLAQALVSPLAQQLA